MKLFGKKTKKATTPTAKKQNKSDPIIEELLKKDPSTWNAKQRRLVKRYRDRRDIDAQQNEVTKDDQALVDTETTNDVAAMKSTMDQSKDVEAPDVPAERMKKPLEEDEAMAITPAIETAADEGSLSERSSSSSESDDNAEDEEAKSQTDEVHGEPRQQAESETTAGTKRPAEQMEPSTKSSTSEGTAKDIDEDLQAKLDTLNSKQRRTLVREFQRTGDLEHLKSETDKLLQKSTAPSVVQPPKKKRRREKVDWSKLPPEERLRREDQRRKQELAAKARESADPKAETKHKHPLNSERRRANRRKPKWLKRQPPVSSKS